MNAAENIVYGANDRNTLNVFSPKAASKTLRPVMLQIHGGGWMIGHSEYQGLPLRNKLVDAGWVFVSINYRLSPKHKFPDHIVDCKKALRWIKETIEEYGGDPNFIMTTGGSAGGHLCSLLALTENRHQDILQPGFEDQDTSVQGAIPMYGVYDFSDRNDLRHGMPMTGYLQDYVMPHAYQADDSLWEIASPIAQVHADRPPFMVIHGELDSLSFVEDAQFFVKALQESSDKPCVYTQLEKTQHAFDIFYSPRCIHSIHAMHTFAEHTYSQYLKGDYISAAESKQSKASQS
ncbi:MAG: alpha/beta hydrolase [Pseudomonadales bacterium]|nr:alpha/beta hydrolase [Pseudomonadales bacterium]